MPVFLLSNELIFPPPQLASKEGIIAIGGDLDIDRLLLAYQTGVFPWYAEGEPIMWWSPDPRLVLFPDEIRISRTLKKVLRKNQFRVTMDTGFERVISECAGTRHDEEGTWIVDDMIDAYINLHRAGYAHSVEVWQDENLAGGLYGVSLGGTFFGESMFTNISNASSVGLVKLIEYLKSISINLIDCQVKTDHLIRFGAREIPRSRFLKLLKLSVNQPTKKGKWEFV